MKVFISYGAAADQVTALRLQAMGAVNGLTVFVPPAYTRQGAPAEPEFAQKLNEAEVVLGIVRAGLSEACYQELRIAMDLNKKMIVISDPDFATHLHSSVGSNLVVIDPGNPAQAEVEIVQHLKAIEAGQHATQALLALGTLALGLLIFATADQS